MHSLNLDPKQFESRVKAKYFTGKEFQRLVVRQMNDDRKIMQLTATSELVEIAQNHFLFSFNNLLEEHCNVASKSCLLIMK